MSAPMSPGGGGFGCILMAGGTVAAVLLGSAAALTAGGMWPQLGAPVRVLAFLVCAALTDVLLLTGLSIAEPLPRGRS